MRNLTRALITAIALALALTAVAIAAKPKNGAYAGDAISLHVKHGRIVEVTGNAGGKCNAVPIDSKKHIKVKHGKFHFSGKVKNVNGATEGKLTLSGKFKTRTEAKGTYKFVKGSCSTGKKKFTAAIGDAPD
jgi:hypothetical protein